METWILAVLAIFLSLLYAYKRLTDVFDYWRVRNVPYVKPNPIFGNIADVIFQRISIGVKFAHIYRQLSPHKYGGQFMLNVPTLLIRDPDLIKKILTKDFHYFHDRGFNCSPGTDPLFQNLFALNGHHWKDLRKKTVSAFSAAAKMKSMIPSMEECALELVSVLSDGDDGRQPPTTIRDVDIKDLISRMVIDSIGMCAFGLRTGCLRNKRSIFRLKCKSFFEFRYSLIIRAILPKLPTLIIRWFELTLAGKEEIDFFTHLAEETIEHRERNKVIRNDLLDVSIRSDNRIKDDNGISNVNERRRSLKTMEIVTDLMASQYFSFFSGGYETTASAMTFFLYEVAKHPEIEEKLKMEINAILDKYDNRLTPDALKEMKYMDMVYDETLRLYAPSPILFRTCNADYKIEEDDVVIPQGTHIIISIHGLHYDENYYENPRLFNPDRFDEEAKKQRHHYVYLPFGEGPRICIAERFVKIQTKITMIHLIKNFKFRLSPRTKLPLEYGKSIIFTTRDNTLRLCCIRRK